MRAFVSREQSALPTEASASVFITVVIDALERRVVVVADIPGAFMHSGLDPEVYMRLDGLMAELLLEVDKTACEPYLTYQKGQPGLEVHSIWM